jgi:hypothetical protein
VRRDYLAHRGPWFIVLGIAALLCSIAFPPAGLALSILTRRLAKGDLARMNAGQMDPAGQPTTDADLLGLVGVVVACLSLFLFLYLTLGLSLELSRCPWPQSGAQCCHATAEDWTR